MHMFYSQNVDVGLEAGLLDQPRYVPNRTIMRQISPGNATYRSFEPSGGSGDASPSSPGCPPSPV